MIYYTGDIHGSAKGIVAFAQHYELTESDIIVILGDVGANYYGNRRDRYCKDALAKIMDECQHAMAELRNIVEGISKLRDTAYAHYSLLVEQVLKDQITDEQQLEQIMDGLCDFCDEIRFIDLYRSLCRHIYYQYPQLVGEHVALFRALFEGPDEN